MSLFNQTARYLLLTATLIALVGSVGFYTLIHRKIRLEVDEILVSQVEQVQRRMMHRPLVQLVEGDDNPHIEPIRESIPPEFKDLIIQDSLDAHKLVEVRQFRTTVVVDGQAYLVRMRLPYYEFNELARDLSIWIIIGFLVLMTLSVLVGLGFSTHLWRPFYSTIDQLSQFRLDQPASPSFPQTHIREFDLLSRSLSELTQKLNQQFSLQKQFAENASHELQTPLAIASAELDFLLQSHCLEEDDYLHLQRATDALSRLSQLNRSLLLLTQVENDQFASDKPVNLSELVKQSVLDFEPFFAHKLLITTINIQPDVQLLLNHQLAGVLITNLLKNTARHCPVGGHMVLSLTNSHLTIGNTGDPLPFDQSQLFNRFVKDPARSDSLGLGLALVKQICDRYGMQLTYRYHQSSKEHSFQIGLRKSKANNFKFTS